MIPVNMTRNLRRLLNYPEHRKEKFLSLQFDRWAVSFIFTRDMRIFDKLYKSCVNGNVFSCHPMELFMNSNTNVLQEYKKYLQLRPE